MTASGCPPTTPPARPARSLVEGLSPAELRAAALDGELVPLADGFAPLDLPVTASTRAAALAPGLHDPRVIVSDRSAAWVWGWQFRAARLSTSVSIDARIPSTERRRLGAREVVIDGDETVELGGLAVTDPVRTLVDLARHDADADVVELLARGLHEHRIPQAAIDSALARRPRLSFVRLARTRLAAARERAALLDVSRC